VPLIQARLEAFALREIAADEYPDDVHTYSMFECDTCGVAPFELTIEYHTGSEPYDFAGVITGRCVHCGALSVLLSITGEHRRPQQRESAACECGSREFYVALCERYEGEQGLTGFFDEGVVVAQCAACGRNRVLVYTD